MSERRPDQCGHCAKSCAVHYTQVVGAKAVKVSMCAACPWAVSLQEGQAVDQMAKLSKGAALIPRLVASDGACPACGFTREHFKESGRMGCPACYTFFGDNLHPILARLHTSVAHKGRVPRRGPKGSTAERVAELRRQLRERVELEDYEAAAELRDRIEALERA